MENLVGEGWVVLLIGVGCLVWSMGGILLLQFTRLLERISIERGRARLATQPTEFVNSHVVRKDKN